MCLLVCVGSQEQFLGSVLSSAGHRGPPEAAGTEKVGRYVVIYSNNQGQQILHTIIV